MLQTENPFPFMDRGSHQTNKTNTKPRILNMRFL
jgi:hypothetical protein